MNIFYVVCKSPSYKLAQEHREHTPGILGDIADDKFFRKANSSDCTQFNLMFPRIPAHGESLLSLWSPPELLILRWQYGRSSGFCSKSER
jgi:hypothetical protein